MTKAGNSQIMRTITLLLTIFSLSLPAYAKYSGGTGDPNDPYQIATAADLIALGYTPEDYGKHFILTADIDLDPNLPGRKIFESAVIAPNMPDDSWDWEGAFSGVFDGKCHTISHLTIVGHDHLGLISAIQYGGQVRNLGVVNANVASTGSEIGILVGANWSGTVANCFSTGTIKGGHYIGGLIGMNFGRAINCYTTGIVSGNSDIGGLIGLSGGIVDRSHSASSVSGTNTVGGLVGDNYGNISVSYSAGSVSGTNTVGGLVGENCYSIMNCISTGTVNGDDGVGGLVGENIGGDVIKCYSTGIVSGDDDAGGLVGRNELGSVVNCYSTGKVSGYFVGGLVGMSYDGTVIHSFWDKETSGQSSSGGGAGRTTAQMQNPSTFLDAGWDFLGEIRNGLHETWQMPEGGDYPVLSVFNDYHPPVLQGESTHESPYLISTPAELGSLIYHKPKPDSYYKLTQDIDLSGITWPIAAIPELMGVFDGNGFTISNLTIVGHSHLGLIGTQYCQLRNLSIIEANVVGSEDEIGILVGESINSITNCNSTGIVRGSSCVGGLVGDNLGSLIDCYTNCSVNGDYGVGGLVGENCSDVINCHSTGTVNGDNDVGGLVGINDNYSVLNQSYSTGSVSGVESIGGLVGINSGVVINCYSIGSAMGDYYLGGLIGKNAGNVTNCYSTGAIKGDCYSGGLVGENSGSLTNCYSAGAVMGSTDVGGLVGSSKIEEEPWAPVPAVTNCFWDTQTSGHNMSAGGTGKITVEMQTPITFLDASWDFLGEIRNGLHETWQMPESGDYPVLSIFNDFQPPVLLGEGTLESPYLISTPAELGSLIYHRPKPDNCFKLTQDIDMSEITWSIAVIPELVGVFDGSGFTISKLTIVGHNNLGLIGTQYGQLSNLSVVDANVVGAGDEIGILVGTNYESIINCNSTGTVRGSGCVGGLVGFSSGTVIDCYARVTVRGSDGVGGLVGYNGDALIGCYANSSTSGDSIVGGLVGVNFGSLTDCYSSGSVGGNAYLGGLVGMNLSDLTNCYSIGSVSGENDVGGLVGMNYDGSVTHSFWDTQTSGQSRSAGGTGKTTAEMQMGSTFLDAGWDFVDETENGTEDIWWILEGHNYPRLWWENE